MVDLVDLMVGDRDIEFFCATKEWEEIEGRDLEIYKPAQENTESLNLNDTTYSYFLHLSSQE